MTDKFSSSNFDKFRQSGFDPMKLAHNAELQDKRGQQAVGCKFKVGTKKAYVSGVITAVEFARYDYTRTGRSLKLLWKVTMKCSVTGALREFHVAALPRGD